jgi:hypothetical protein
VTAAAAAPISVFLFAVQLADCRRRSSNSNSSSSMSAICMADAAAGQVAAAISCIKCSITTLAAQQGQLLQKCGHSACGGACWLGNSRPLWRPQNIHCTRDWLSAVSLPGWQRRTCQSNSAVSATELLFNHLNAAAAAALNPPPRCCAAAAAAAPDHRPAGQEQCQQGAQRQEAPRNQQRKRGTLQVWLRCFPVCAGVDAVMVRGLLLWHWLRARGAAVQTWLAAVGAMLLSAACSGRG